MDETDDDLLRLLEMLYRTLARANPHLASIVSPERRLSARQVVCCLQGTKHVAFATVNERGEPRVAPLDGVFVRGSFTVSTGARAARLRHLRVNPACSAVHMDGDVVGIAVNDRARILEEGDAGVAEIDAVWSEIYGSSPFTWGKGVVFMVVEPTSMWAYAFHPENFPE